MRIEIIPRYTPITEKPYCCVPAVLQMIQQRRGFDFASQDEIGYQLGLIVPPVEGDQGHLRGMAHRGAVRAFNGHSVSLNPGT